MVDILDFFILFYFCGDTNTINLIKLFTILSRQYVCINWKGVWEYEKTAN